MPLPVVPETDCPAPVEDPADEVPALLWLEVESVGL